MRHGHRIAPGRKRNLILNESGRLTVDGRERTFETVGPASDAPTGMVLVLHGSKQSGRRYVVRYSNGGQMAIKLVHEIPDRLSGAVIISATLPVAANLVVNDKHLPMPIVLIHGTLDPVVPYGGGIASMWGLGSGGRGLSAFDSAQYFARRNGITAAPGTEQLRHLPESGKTSAIRQRWAQEGKDSVTLYTVTNGGHVIPNPTTRASLLGRTTRDIDAADTVAELMAEPAEK